MLDRRHSSSLEIRPILVLRTIQVGHGKPLSRPYHANSLKAVVVFVSGSTEPMPHIRKVNMSRDEEHNAVVVHGSTRPEVLRTT